MSALDGIAGAPGVTIRPGRRPGVVEVVFDAKPAETVRSELKARGFRWARTYGCWYGPAERLPDHLTDSSSTGHAPDIDLLAGA